MRGEIEVGFTFQCLGMTTKSSLPKDEGRETKEGMEGKGVSVKETPESGF